MLGLMSCLRILLTFGRRLPLIFSACSDLLHRRGRPPRPQSGLSIRVSRFWILLRIERTCCTQPCVGRNHFPITVYSSTNYSTRYALEFNYPYVPRSKPGIYLRKEKSHSCSGTSVEFRFFSRLYSGHRMTSRTLQY